MFKSAENQLRAFKKTRKVSKIEVILFMMGF